MALFFHVSTDTNDYSYQVPPGWLPSIEDGKLKIPANGDFVSFDAGSIIASHLSRRRVTPKLDGLKAGVQFATNRSRDAADALVAYVRTNIEPSTSEEIQRLLSIFYGCERRRHDAETDLSKYELATEKARNTPRKPKAKPEKKPKRKNP